jgi:predicted transcriptional regulator
MESLKVKDYMLTRPISFRLGQPIAQVVQGLLKYKQIGGPVIDAQKHIVGWISEQDCLAKLIEATYHCEQVSIVDDVMRTDVLTVDPEDSIFDLAQSMLSAKPKMYPVAQDGKLIGVITRHEMLIALNKHLNACYGTSS